MGNDNQDGNNEVAAGQNAEHSITSTLKAATADGAKDPIKVMIGILKDDSISDADKRYLIECSQNRFKHRRRIAYVCLATIISSTALLFIAAFANHGQTLSAISEYKDLFIWINFFLTSIVGAYYGASAWRPSS